MPTLTTQNFQRRSAVQQYSFCICDSNIDAVCIDLLHLPSFDKKSSLFYRVSRLSALQ